MEQGDKIIHYIVEKYVILSPVSSEISDEIRSLCYELFFNVANLTDDTGLNFERCKLPLCITKGIEDDIIIPLSR